MPRLTAITAAVAVTLLAAACGTGVDTTAAPSPTATERTSPTPTGPPTPSGTVAAPAPRVQTTSLSEPIEHVHGLVVDDAGSLRAGTHDGVRVIDPDETVAVVGPGDDLMGMTGQPGIRRLVSSGHPGPDSPLPNPVGLIASDDGGQTWQPRSLAGQIDFHALASTQEAIVGFDGVTGLLVSSDGGRSWEQGAAVAALSLAMVGEQVWATTPDGLLHSTDRAATFTLLDDAPQLWLISAGTDSSLWGIDIDGLAWRSRDGLAWDRHKQLPPVEAIAAVDYRTALAVSQTDLVTLTA